MQTYRIILGILLISLIMLNTGCSNVALTKDQKVEQAFEKHLSIYPVKSLEDFYEMEGYRDKNFDKDDKGTWIISSYFVKSENEIEPLYSNGIVLFLNRNNKSTKGKYIVKEKYDDINKNKLFEYPVTVKGNKIVPTKDVPKKIKEDIENYRLIVQDESFGDLGKLKKLESRHNEGMPLYTINYQLNDNNNVNKWVQKHYNLEPQKAELYIERTGNLEGGTVGDFYYKVRYDNVQKEAIKYYYESIIYQPTKEE
ncbi:tandem-type lipoprotein [Macrococcoides canis]|uniref:tandem-type lipoprotein n=1 Tax=Macrococcoides canis TaxID=1855823 RepID=UPI0013E90E8A|nr:tandem-type lipoprotein [Macrococcus canis]QIH76505.1 tandem-type lipoprotein [Macrococcus canis]